LIHFAADDDTRRIKNVGKTLAAANSPTIIGMPAFFN
jgi:hypothetical protein